MNIAALVDRGTALLEQAIATSGTTVTISRDVDDQDETVNLTTLAITDPTPAAPLIIDAAALVIATAAEDVPAGTDRVDNETVVRVFLPVAVTDIRQGDILTVTASRDVRLTGAQLLVTAVLDDPLGLRRQVEARRR